MKRLRIIGLVPLALFAFGALVSSSAWAIEGLLPFTKKNVTILGKNTVLEDTAGGKGIKCKVLTGSGSFTSDNHGSAILDFHECEVIGFAEISLGDKPTNEIKEALILMPVFLSICLIDSAKLVFGVYFQLSEAVHTDGNLVGLDILEGAFIGELLSQKTKLFVTDITGKGGAPSVTECVDEKGGVKKHTLTVKVNAEPALSAIIKMEGVLLQFEEELELMDK
jgi:hypothetical protein